MKELCEKDRPREKLLSKGASALGDSELLAVLIRCGTASCSALDLGNKMLSLADGSLVKLFGMPAERLCSIPGIKSDKVASILAAFELGKRFLESESSVIKKPLMMPEHVSKLMLPRLKGLDHEECWCLYLNRANYLLCKERVSVGGLCSTTLDPRQVVRKALEKNASAVILVHNHPTGNPMPSTEDVRQTEKLKEVASACGLSLLDHVIISDDSFFSFADDTLK